MFAIDPISFHELSLILIGLYLSKAVHYFVTSVKVLKQDSNLTEQERSFCLKVLVVAAILWPIVRPISALEKRTVSHLQQFL
jgi:hypothetical protein